MKQGPQFTIHEIKANSVIYIYTFIHIYNREISKPTGFKNRQPGPVSYRA